MKAQYTLLSLAIASGLALASAPADAAGVLKSAAVSRAQSLLAGNAGAIRRAAGDTFASENTAGVQLPQWPMPEMTASTPSSLKRCGSDAST